MRLSLVLLDNLQFTFLSCGLLPGGHGIEWFFLRACASQYSYDLYYNWKTFIKYAMQEYDVHLRKPNWCKWLKEEECLTTWWPWIHALCPLATTLCKFYCMVFTIYWPSYCMPLLHIGCKACFQCLPFFMKYALILHEVCSHSS